MAMKKPTEVQILEVYNERYRKKFLENVVVKPQEPTKSTGARLPETRYARGEAMSKKTGYSMNTLMNVAFEKFLCEYENHENKEDTKTAEWLKVFKKKPEEEQKQLLIKMKVEVFDLRQEEKK
jgi:predicted DNA-binding protein